jgi:hypothetical protein
MHLQVWWKARKDLSKLHPVRKFVARRGRFGETQIYQQTYYIAEEPPADLPEGGHNLDDFVSLLADYYWDYLKPRAEGRGQPQFDPLFGLKVEDWERVVRNAHKDLEGTIPPRIGVVYSDEAPPTAAHGRKRKIGLPYFCFLKTAVIQRLRQYLIKKMKLPYVYSALLSGIYPDYLLSHFRLAEILNATLDPSAREAFLFEGIGKPSDQPISDVVIDPNTLKVIPTEEYLKKWLPKLGQAISMGLAEKMDKTLDEIQSEWVGPPDYTIEEFVHPEEGKPYPPPPNTYEYGEWKLTGMLFKSFKPLLQTYLAFVTSEKDRDAALLGLYAGYKALDDFSQLCRMPQAKTLSAQKLIQVAQKAFEQRLEEGKQVLGLEHANITPEHAWSAMWTAIENLHELDELETSSTLRRLLTRSEFNVGNAILLREVVKKITGKDLIEAVGERVFYDNIVKYKPSLVELFRRMTGALAGWMGTLRKLAIAELKWEKTPLKRGLMLTKLHLIDEPQELEKVVASAMKDTQEVVSASVQSVRKVKDSFFREALRFAYSAFIDYTPMGFYSLAEWAANNPNRMKIPFAVGVVRNSFAIHAYHTNVRHGEMWGILEPKKRTAYLVSIPHVHGPDFIINHARHIFAPIFQVPPTHITIDHNVDLKSLVESYLSKELPKHLREKAKAILTEGRAVKVSVKEE